MGDTRKIGLSGIDTNYFISYAFEPCLEDNLYKRFNA